MYSYEDNTYKLHDATALIAIGCTQLTALAPHCTPLVLLSPAHLAHSINTLQDTEPAGKHAA